jgi:hypothetical protein
VQKVVRVNPPPPRIKTNKKVSKNLLLECKKKFSFFILVRNYAKKAVQNFTTAVINGKKCWSQNVSSQIDQVQITRAPTIASLINRIKNVENLPSILKYILPSILNFYLKICLYTDHIVNTSLNSDFQKLKIIKKASRYIFVHKLKLPS